MNKKDMNDRLTKGRLALCYTLLEIGFWGYACSTFGYEAVFLEGRGISTGMVGIVIALGCILGAVIQPILADWADTGKFSLHKITGTLGVLSLITYLGLCFTGTNHLANGILFMLGTTEFFTLIPLTNSLSVYYNVRGHELNYAFPRAIGSFSYAITSSFRQRKKENSFFTTIPEIQRCSPGNSDDLFVSECHK